MLRVPAQALAQRRSAGLPRSLRKAIAVAGLVAMAALAVSLAWRQQSSQGPFRLLNAEVTGSTTAAPLQTGPSGLPLPRFVTLKANKVNVRKGPSHEHAIAWVFQRKGLPVEVIAESDNWRKIRDSDGSEGWIQQSMLTGKRNALVAGWTGDKGVLLRAEPRAGSQIVVKMSAGVVGQIDSCDGGWCYLAVDDFEGYARQDELWGVYPGEVVD